MTRAPTGVIVRASAGTGKTHSLAMQCLALLASGESIDGILATTFTRKAAGEIRSRVLEMLAKADTGDEKALADIRAVVPGFTRARARELLVHVISRVHRVQIMTIDALSARMASMLAFDIGLTPGWRVIDDLEDADVRVRALDRVLERAGNSAMMPLLYDLHAGAMKASIHRTLLGFVLAGERAWRSCAGSPGPWDTVPEPAGMLQGHALSSALTALAETPCTVMTGKGTPNATWAKAHASCIELALANEWEAFLESKLPWSADPDATFARAEMPEAMRRVYLPVRNHAAAVLVHLHRIRVRATVDLIGRFLPEYEALKDESSVLRFEDFPRMLRRASEHDFTTAYFRMDTRFRHILLDEFQDTSSDQFALLEPMIDEVLAGSEDRRSVLIVGDPKQSLYSWRNAAPGLMNVVEARWPEKFKRDELVVSWRSSPAVLDAVNTVFGSLRDNPVLANSAGAEEMAGMFSPHSARFTDRPGEVVVREIGEPEPRSAEEADAPAWALEAADLVKEIADRTPRATIGVLTRKGKTAGRIIGVLRGRGVFASAERGTALGDTPAVAAFASVLTLIEHPGHSQAAYHVAQSPVGREIGITDHEAREHNRRVISRLRRSMCATGVAPECVRMLRACAPDMDTRTVRRFEQLVDMCEAFDRDPSARLDDLTRQIWSTSVEDPSGSPVRVMTIHAAKGLEFDAVILPELGGAWSVRARDVMVDHPNPLDTPRAVSLYAKEVLRRISPELERIHRASLERSIMDELCVLYVGMTRAKSRLVMLVPTPTKAVREAGDAPSVSAASVIRGALGIGAEGEPGAVLWRHAHGEIPPDPVAPDAKGSDADAGVPAPRFTLRGGERSAWRLDRKSPSALGTHARLPLSDRADLAGAGRYGELMHAWFERVVWSEDGAPDRAVLTTDPCAEGMDPARMDRAYEQFQRAMALPAIAQALSRSRAEAKDPGASVEVRAELPFLMRSRATSHGAVISGRMDRVTIGWKDGRARWAEIVDFKTDAHDLSNPGWIGERVDTHRAQMEAYRSAAAEMFGIAPEHVGVALVFTSVPAVAWIDPA